LGGVVARPRVLEIGPGQVVLKNLPRDLGDLIQLYIENLNPNQPEEARPSSAGKKHIALSIKKNKSGMYELVEIEYTEDKTAALVVSITPLNENKRLAENMFKIALVDKGLI
jgi:ribosomal protein S6